MSIPLVLNIYYSCLFCISQLINIALSAKRAKLKHSLQIDLQIRLFEIKLNK